MSVEGKFLSKEINDLFWREGLTLVTAESCTAGSVAAAITAVAGSSHFFKGRIIAYSNEIKENLLGVNHQRAGGPRLFPTPGAGRRSNLG